MSLQLASRHHKIPLQGGARPFPNPTLHSTSSASGQACCCLGSTASSSCLLKVALPLKLRRLWGPFRCRLFQTFALFFSLLPLGSRLKIIPTSSQPSPGAYLHLSTCCSPCLSHPLSLFRFLLLDGHPLPLLLALCSPPFTNSCN